MNKKKIVIYSILAAVGICDMACFTSIGYVGTNYIQKTLDIKLHEYLPN